MYSIDRHLQEMHFRATLFIHIPENMIANLYAALFPFKSISLVHSAEYECLKSDFRASAVCYDGGGVDI